MAECQISSLDSGVMIGVTAGADMIKAQVGSKKASTISFITIS